MKKHYTTVLIALSLALLTQAQTPSTPVTAVSFPKEVIDVNAGKIEFYAKLSGYSGAIPVGGYTPYFFYIEDGQRTYYLGFNANDGAGNGGLTGSAGYMFLTGTGYFDDWTYEDVYGAGQVDAWHHYVFQWNKNGIPGVDDGTQKTAIFVDGKLHSGRWQMASESPGTFGPFTSCPTLNLIAVRSPSTISGKVIVDEFKVYDGSNKLVLWNTLGSKSEVENSVVGPGGSFNGGGDATFVKGISGNAVIATPVYSGGTPNCGGVTLSCPSNKVVNTKAGVCYAVVSGIDPVMTPAGSNTAVTYTQSGATKGSGTGSASGHRFNKGVTTVTYALVSGGSQSCSFTVTVNDAEAPAITNVSVTPSVLWPPNHKRVPVTVNYTVTDNCSATASLSVSSNESLAASDVQVLDAHHLLLRAERSGRNKGRRYTIFITAKDASGNQATQHVTVTVPHDMSGITQAKGAGSTNLKVRALPSYTQGTFTLLFQSNSDKPLQVRVLNAQGSVIEARSNIAANGSIQIGSSYAAGVYVAEVMQGSSRATVKLVKISQ